MNQLRKCRSADFDSCSKSHRRLSSGPGLQAYPKSVPIKPIEAVDSKILYMLSHGRGDSYTHQLLLDSVFPHEASEAISPLFLDNQYGGYDSTSSSESLSAHEFSTEPQATNKYDLTAFHDPEIHNDEDTQYSGGAEAFVGNRELQQEFVKEDQLVDDNLEKLGLPIQLTNAIELVLRDQQKISGMRIQLGEMRSGLNENRNVQVLQWADAAKELKLMLSNAPLEKPIPASLETQLQSLETINQYSDDYLQQETEYQNFQRQLETEENSLQRRETKLAELLRQFSCKSQTQDSKSPDRRNAPDAHTGMLHTWALSDDKSDYLAESSTHKIMHPLVEEFLSHLGDARLYHERLVDLSCEYAEVAAKKSSREMVNLPLDQESQDFLSYYETERLEVQRLLANEIEITRSLRQQCERAGLSLPEDIDEELMEEPAAEIRESLPLNRDLLWLSELEESNPFFELANSGNFDAYHFINLWILHQLRHSTSFISRFKANPRFSDIAIHDDALSQWVVELWFQDGSPRIASPLRTASGSG